MSFIYLDFPAAFSRAKAFNMTSDAMENYVSNIWEAATVAFQDARMQRFPITPSTRQKGRETGDSSSSRARFVFL